MALLSRDQIREAAKAELPRKTLTLNFPPQLVGDVIVRGMGGKELSIFNEGLFHGNGKKRRIVTTNIQARMAVRCVVDEKGIRMFTDEDAEWLGELRADALAVIFKEIQKLSGLGDDADEDDEAGK